MGKMRIAECDVCGQFHEWHIDDGMGAAFDQGWIHCEEYGGPIPIGKDSTELIDE
jgi:hypothetical protein